jgi:hypothetical protein
MLSAERGRFGDALAGKNLQKPGILAKKCLSSAIPGRKSGEKHLYYKTMDVSNADRLAAGERIRGSSATTTRRPFLHF